MWACLLEAVFSTVSAFTSLSPGFIRENGPAVIPAILVRLKEVKTLATCAAEFLAPNKQMLG